MSEEIRLIEIKKDILADNKDLANNVRKTLKEKKTFLLNLMSSPGAGKTSLILQTIKALKKEYPMGVIEADIDSTVDTEKVMAEGINAVQLRTGGLCHLDASMVSQGLEALKAEGLKLIIIENVGNLVCPAEFDTGSTKNAMILSVPEGDDKPLKYPLMFSTCDILVINKVDYLSIADFDMNALKERVKKLNPNIKIVKVSCKTQDGIEDWISWLKEQMAVL